MSGRILSVEQINDLLDYLDYDDKRRWRHNGDSVQICCPVHHEKNPSCGISVTLQVFHCFSCGAKGDLAWLLFRARPDEFKRVSDAADFIRHRYKVDVSSFIEDFRKMLMRYEDFFPDHIRKDIRPVKPMYTLAPFMSGKETYQYFYDRGFDDEILETFKIGRDLEHQTVTIPVFWEDGQLAGVIGRYIFPRGQNERYKVYDFERSSLLFPIDKFEPEDDTCILVEGLFDAMRLYQLGYRNALAFMTNTMSEKQRNYLINSCNRVVLMLDNDERGVASVSKITDQLKKNVEVFHVDYPNREGCKDPCDCTEREIWRMLGTKRSYFQRKLLRL